MSAQTAPEPTLLPLFPVAMQTTREVVAAYLEEKRLHFSVGAYSPKAYRRLEDYLTSFLTDLGNRPLTQCRKNDLVKWLLMHPSWRSPHTQHDHIGVVVTCFRWAEDEALIAKSPYRRPKNIIAPLEPRKPIRFDAFWAMIKVLRRPERRRYSRSLVRLCLLFLWETGARTCEAWTARWEWVDWQAHTVTDPRPKTYRKTGRSRTLVFGGRMRRLLRWLWVRSGRPTEGVIFKNARGRAWNSSRFAKHFRRFAQIAGVPAGITAYSIRHGFFCEGILRGVGNKQMADAGGHTTTRYVDSWYGRSTKTHSDYLHRINAQVHGR